MSLSELLISPNITVKELFSGTNMFGEMKENQLKLFIKFCKTNEKFTKQLITLGIKTAAYKNKQNETMQRVHNIANNILTYESDSNTIAELFVMDDNKRMRLYSEESDQVLEEIITNEETGQLVIGQNKSKDQPLIQNQYLFLFDLLDYLNQEDIDQNCINYLTKVVNTVIKGKNDQIFEFFTANFQYLRRMIELTIYPSISFSLIKLLNHTQDQKHRGLKLKLIDTFIEQLLNHIDDNEFYIYLEFVEEIFEKNRHRSEEQDEFKVVTQPFFKSDLINKMVSRALETKSLLERANCFLFLLKVIQRMNVDEEKDPYSYGGSQQTPKPTMKFQCQQIFESFQRFIQLIPVRPNQNPQQILNYFELMLAICKNSNFTNIILDVNKTIDKFLVAAENQKKNGIIKNKITMLIQLIIANRKINKLDLSSKERDIQDIFNACQTESLCFAQKLEVILKGTEHQQIQQIVDKYSGLLAPNSYTQKRSIQIKELDFAKKAQEILKKQKLQVEKPQTQSNEEDASQGAKAENISETANSVKNCTNLIDCDTLKKKIQKKKEQKSGEQNQSKIIKADGEAQKEKYKQSDKLEKQNLSQSKNQSKSACEVNEHLKNKNIVNYFAKYLVLF